MHGHEACMQLNYILLTTDPVTGDYNCHWISSQ